VRVVGRRTAPADRCTVNHEGEDIRAGTRARNSAYRSLAGEGHTRVHHRNGVGHVPHAHRADTKRGVVEYPREPVGMRPPYCLTIMPPDPDYVHELCVFVEESRYAIGITLVPCSRKRVRNSCRLLRKGILPLCTHANRGSKTAQQCDACTVNASSSGTTIAH